MANKSDLVELIFNNLDGFSRSQIEQVVNGFIDASREILGKEDRLVLKGLGTFRAKKRGSRVIKDPRSGGDLEVQEKWTVRFKASSTLNNSVDFSKFLD
jgi:integration host factor subunit beta